jgi:esterase/lipase
MKKYLLMFLLALLTCTQVFAGEINRFAKTNIGSDLYNFSSYHSLDEYTTKYRQYIKQFHPSLTDNEINNIAPLDVKKMSRSCSKKTGILFLHGLGDSPFLMSDLVNNIVRNQNCIVVKSPIIPGNALVPGASLEPSDKDWRNMVNFAISDFKNNDNIDQVIVIGFSTGGALALNQILNDNPNIIAAAFLSPAFDIGVSTAKAMLLKFVDAISNNRVLYSLGYLSKYDDVNIYKYESFSYHGINDLYKVITENNKLLKQKKSLSIPTFFAFSDVDETVNSKTTIAMINNNFSEPSGSVFSNNGVEIKPTIKTIRPVDLEKKILDLSHISIPVADNNYYYGKNAKENFAKENFGCLQYYQDQNQYNSCKVFDAKFYYGETTKENNDQYKNVSRITYNPYFLGMAKDLNGFISSVLTKKFKK